MHLRPLPFLAPLLGILAGLSALHASPYFDGFADSAAAREAAWSATTPGSSKTLRLQFHIVKTSRFTTNPAQLTENSARERITELTNALTSIYEPSGIEFSSSVTFHALSPPNILPEVRSGDEKLKLMRQVITDGLARSALNIVVVPMRNLGFDGHAHFPWSPISMRAGYGIMVGDEFVLPFPLGDGSQGRLRPETLAHEIGHALGLHHLERGVIKVSGATPYEIEDLPQAAQEELKQESALNSAETADLRGDFCADTPPIPAFLERELTYTVTSDENGVFIFAPNGGSPNITSPAWSPTSLYNLMRISGQRQALSFQQSQRMHAWINARLSSWVIGHPAAEAQALTSSLTFRTSLSQPPNVTLEWTALPTQNFIVERADNPTFSNPVTTLHAGSISPDPVTPSRLKFIDTTIQPSQIGQTFFYRVKRNAADALFTYSRKMQIRVAGASGGKARPSYIAVPTAIRSIPGGNLITWDDVDDEEIAGFEIRRWDITDPTSTFVTDPTSTFARLGPIAAGLGRNTSFYDQASLVHSRNYHYQVLTYVGDWNSPIYSTNVSNPREQGLARPFSATPPPSPPILTYTIVKTGAGDTAADFRGKINLRYAGNTPTAVTPPNSISATIQLAIDGAPFIDQGNASSLPSSSSNNLTLADIPNLEVGKNYHAKLSLKQTINTTGLNTPVTQASNEFRTIRIPGKIETWPIRREPAPSSTNVSTQPTFTWSPVLDAASYDVIIDGPGQPSTTIRVPATQTSLTLTTPLNSLSDYTWRTRAVNELGLGPVSTNPRPFRTGLDSPSIIRPTPTDSLVVSPERTKSLIIFKWSRVAGPLKYRLVVETTDTNPIQEPVRVEYVSNSNVPSVTELTYQLTEAQALPPGGYRWRIISIPTATGDSTLAPSPWTSFQINARPFGIPSQVAPINEEPNRTITPLYVWTKTVRTTDYVIEVVQGSDTTIRKTFGGIAADNLLGTPLIGVPVDGQPNQLSFRPTAAHSLNFNRLHWWRIRARNEHGAGDWSAQNEPPSAANGWQSFRTGIPAPTLTSPANLATIGDSSPTLSWTSHNNLQTHDIQVFKDSVSTPNKVAELLNHTGTSWNMPLATYDLADGSYIWRVRTLSANEENGGVSDWSQFAFTLSTPPRIAPVPVGPAEASINRSTTPNFQWNGVQKATNYRIEIRQGTNAPFFSQVGITGTGSPLTYTLPGGVLAHGTAYQWRIAGVSGVGQGPFSSPWVGFSTNLPTSAPDTPANGTSVSDRTPILRAVEVAGAGRYEFEVYKTVTTGVPYGSGSSVAGSRAWTATPDLSNGTYFWRVRAAGGTPSGQSTGNWSGFSSFLVQGEPTNAPTPVSPAHEATNRALRPTFTWAALNLASSYDLQIKNGSTGDIVMTVRDIIGTTHQITTDLAANSNYYWRVRGKNTFGIGPWSADPNDIYAKPWYAGANYSKFQTKP